MVYRLLLFYIVKSDLTGISQTALGKNFYIFQRLMSTELKFIPKYEAELPPKEWDPKELDFFTPANGAEIQILSRGMEKDEVLI